MLPPDEFIGTMPEQYATTMALLRQGLRRTKCPHEKSHINSMLVDCCVTLLVVSRYYDKSFRLPRRFSFVRTNCGKEKTFFVNKFENKMIDAIMAGRDIEGVRM